MSIHYKQGNSTTDYANDGEVINRYREGLEAEALLDELETIYLQSGWRNDAIKAKRENEIKKRLSEIYQGVSNDS